MDRCFQLLLILAMVALCWLLMLALHESGHVLAGSLAGARLDTVHLPLVGISRTGFSVNPHPLSVAWAGPVCACALPLAAFGGARCFVGKNRLYLLAWFAGFCLIANGAYLLGGAILTGGGDDGGVILQQGGARWQLIVFGVVAGGAGLRLWNGLGPYFGLGSNRGQVSRRATIAVVLSLVVVVCIQFVASSAWPEHSRGDRAGRSNLTSVAPLPYKWKLVT